MPQEFFIPTVLPGLNELLFLAKTPKLGAIVYSELKKRWAQNIGFILYQKKIKPMVKAYFIFTWIEKNEKRDPDNISGAGKKIILDSLVVNKILENDGWKEILGWKDRFLVDPLKPGVIVQLFSEEEARCLVI